MSLIIRRCTRIGVWSRSFVLMSDTNGLWSVSSLNFGRPMTKCENISHAHVRAKHSFSICAHLFSVDVEDRYEKATGWSCPSWSCIRHAPSPKLLASAELHVGLLMSLNLRTVSQECLFAEGERFLLLLVPDEIGVCSHQIVDRLKDCWKV